MKKKLVLVLVGRAGVLGEDQVDLQAFLAGQGAVYGERHRVAGLLVGDIVGNGGGGSHLGVVDGGDHVVLLQAGGLALSVTTSAT